MAGGRTRAAGCRTQRPASGHMATSFRVLAGGTTLAPAAPVPSLTHEAPLVVLREEPALIAALLRESLGVPVPDFVGAELGDPGFTQAVPAEFRADLVIHLRGAGPTRPTVLGLVVEIQRARDERKRRSWPLYLAALHARLDCPTGLVVIATDDAVARWAAAPITSLQLGSTVTPLVLRETAAALARTRGGAKFNVDVAG